MTRHICLLCGISELSTLTEHPSSPKVSVLLNLFSKCNVIIVELKCRTIGGCIDVTWTNQINVRRGNDMLTIEEAQIMQALFIVHPIHDIIQKSYLEDKVPPFVAIWYYLILHLKQY
jgi:hypothetical protein